MWEICSINFGVFGINYKIKILDICSFIITIEYMIAIFFIKSVFSIVIIGVFAIAWLGSYILSELLKKAIDYKEENELTI